MDIRRLTEHRDWIRAELGACVRFWLDNGMDNAHGGVYTCLDRAGNVYSTDKSVWMQGRCAWLFSYLCAEYGARDEWLGAAKSCLDFMEAHCVNRDMGGRMYFTVTADGRPLRMRRYCFSEGFYAIANAEYARVTGDEACLERAKCAYELIWALNKGAPDPAGFGPKTIAETRIARALADPMIYLNICAALRRADMQNTAVYDERARECADTILRYHRKKDMKCTLESVGVAGEFMRDITSGRVLNPGHAIECSWFLMEYANYARDKALYNEALGIFNDAFDAGWDNQYQGLLYFVDCLGMPSEAYEHDMKLWWPHCEALIAALMAYRDTRQEAYYEKFARTLDYCKRVFSDPEYGEWYGYLRRDGAPTMPPAKGSTFKGPFHLPRMLIMTDKMLTEILDKP